MDIKFDAAAAEQLLRQMDTYCSGIVKETRELMTIANDSKVWNDKQHVAFQRNVTEMAKDLNNALSLESEYMRTFNQRVQELRG